MRFLLKWGLLAALLGVVAAVPHLYRQVDERIRRVVEARFNEHYRSLGVPVRVTVRSAGLVEGRGIEIRDLAIVSEAGAETRDEMVRVEEIFVACPADVEHLLTGRIQARWIRVRRPTLRARCGPDGRWDVVGLFPLPQFSDRPPQIHVENGTVEIVGSRAGAGLTLREVNLVFTPEAGRGLPRRDVPRSFQGTLAGDFVRQVKLSGRVDPQAGGCAVVGRIEGLEVSPEFRAALPAAWAAWLGSLGAFRGEVDVDEFGVRYDPGGDVPWQFQALGKLVRGRIDDPRLPHSVTDMTAAFRLDQDGFQVENLFAKSGQATCWIKSWRQRGYGPGSPMTLEAQVRRLELGWEWIDILPEPLKALWPRYSPSGTIHADVKLAYDGQTWDPEVTVQCLNVGFTYSKFPYRLQPARGGLSLKDDVFQLNVVGYSGGQPVRISGRVVDPLTRPRGWVWVQADDLALDQKLFDALPEAHRRVVHDLAPRGTVRVDFQFRNDTPDGRPRRWLQVDLNRCSLCYRGFPYPLANVQGRLTMTDGRWVFSNVTGTNDTARVRCQGWIDPEAEGHQLELKITAEDLPLDEELRDALAQPTMRDLWGALRLRGSADIEATVRHHPAWPRPHLAFRAAADPETTTIQLAAFPYRLEGIRGTLAYDNGQVTLEEFHARHGQMRLSGAAACSFRPDGSWQLDLNHVAVDGLPWDRDLIQALPERLRKAVDAVRPEGPIYLRGDLRLGRGPDRTDPLVAQWTGRIGLYQGKLDMGVVLENLHGEISVDGQFDGQHFQSHGQWALDSVTCRDIQWTNVKGPFWIDDRQLLVGTGAAARIDPQPSARPSQKPHRWEPVTAALFGGTAYLDAQVTFGPSPRYWVKASVADAQLSRCAQELLPGQQDLRGRILAGVDLRGTGRSLHAMTGLGNIQLRDADIYELPLMIALLKILSIKEPDRTAFSESDIRFRIEGGHIYLDSISFRGDAISLEGVGDMDFDSTIQMAFRARLGRRKLNLPVIQEILGGASEQIMIIHVTGTLDNPQTRKEAFPGVNHALQQIQADLRRSAAGQRPLRSGRWIPHRPQRLPRLQ